MHMPLRESQRMEYGARRVPAALKQSRDVQTQTDQQKSYITQLKEQQQHLVHPPPTVVINATKINFY
jgi:hypothetical protein